MAIPDSSASGAETQLEALSRALDCGLAHIRDGRIERVNPALARMIGAAPEALSAQKTSSYLVDTDGRPLDAPVAGPAQLRSADGRLRPVELRPADGTLWLVIDRQRERTLEAEVWDLSREREPGAAHEPLRDEVAGLIEHEIGTAATVLRGYLHMLSDPKIGELANPQLGWVREARRASDRISSLAENLLCVASAGADALALAQKALSVREPVEAAMAAARPSLDRRGLTMRLEIAPGTDCAITGDADRLEQVFLNLMHNASKFAPADSAIAVSIDSVELEAGAEVTVSIADQGPGVDVETAERIFLPFVQASAPGKSSEGVGLGLAVCRHITVRHGGRIAAVGGIGSGLFRVTLPVAREGRDS